MASRHIPHLTNLGIYTDLQRANKCVKCYYAADSGQSDIAHLSTSKRTPGVSDGEIPQETLITPGSPREGNIDPLETSNVDDTNSAFPKGRSRFAHR